jgi:hypothetical protein
MSVPVTRAHAVLAVLALALAGTGASCGEQEPTDEDAVRAKLAELANATRAKRYGVLCDRVFDPRLVARVERIGLPCEVAMERALGEVDDPQLTIGRIQVTGTRATAEVRTSAAGQEPSRDVVELVKRPRGWRVSSLAGPSPPSPSP